MPRSRKRAHFRHVGEVRPFLGTRPQRIRVRRVGAFPGHSLPTPGVVDQMYNPHPAASQLSHDTVARRSIESGHHHIAAYTVSRRR